MKDQISQSQTHVQRSTFNAQRSVFNEIFLSEVALRTINGRATEHPLLPYDRIDERKATSRRGLENDEVGQNRFTAYR